MKRRDFLKLAGAASVAGCATPASPAKARVVVVGGGFGGATAAKYIRMWDSSIDVVLVERESAFVSCPISNLVLSGHTKMADISRGYEGLRKYGVQVVRDEVAAIDAAKKTVRLARGGDLAYERLVVSPGIDFNFGEVQGFEAAMQAGSVLHAWKAGPQTVALRKRAWSDLYPGIIEYRGNSRAVAVDGNARSVRLELEDVKGDVLNVVPPHRAADIAQKSGLITTNNRWCDVDWRTMESKAVKGVHVLGDATLSAPAMPKSGSMANNHAKIAAAAIVEQLNGRAPQPLKIINTCYSFVGQKEAIRVTSVHEWEPGQATLVAVKGSGGVSSARSEAEATYAWNWARTIWADSLG
jgi:sulfite dehydrogenase